MSRKSSGTANTQFSSCTFPQGRSGLDRTRERTPLKLLRRLGGYPMGLRVIPTNPEDDLTGAAGPHGPRPRATPVSLTCRRCRWQISWPMGVQQYACMLGLSRGQHYLLYPKQLTL